MRGATMALAMLGLTGSLVDLHAESVVLLDERFDGEVVSSDWVQVSTNDGRIRIVDDPENAGNRIVVMDDAVDDAVNSKNVLKRVLPIPRLQDLRLMLDFDSHNDEINGASLSADSIDDESHFDGIVIRLDGERYSGRIASDALTIGANTISLSTIFSQSELTSSQSITLELHQYDNFMSPDDGLSWDNISLVGTLKHDLLVEPPSQISESDGTFTMPLIYDGASSASVPIFLYRVGATEPHGVAQFPEGATSAALTFPGFDDDIFDGPEQVALYLSDGASQSEVFTIAVEDDELAGLSLALPNPFAEFGGGKLASVAVNVELTRTLEVNLRSSHPELVSVPSSISISRWNSSREQSFTVTPLSDPRILGDQEVTITASVGAESVAQTLVLLEGNDLSPSIGGPDLVTEGQEDLTFAIGINAVTENVIVVTLSSSHSDLELEATEIEIPAGQSVVAVSGKIGDDSIAQGNREITLTATTVGGAESTFTMIVIDNDISGFNFTMPRLVEKGTTNPFTVYTVNQSGGRVSEFEGEVDVILVDREGETETVLLNDVSFLGGSLTTTLLIPETSKGDTIRVRSATGVTSDSIPLIFFNKLDFPAVDLAYDETREKLYAISGGSALPGFLHSLTSIDTNSLQVETPLFLGDDPTVMAITENDQYVYVGQKGSRSYVRVDLASFTKDETVVLKDASVWANDAFTPLELLTIPGRPRDLIVSQDHVTSSYSSVRSYFNGVVKLTGNSHDSWSMAPGATPGIFYGFNHTDTGFDFNKAQLTADGFTILESKRGMVSGFSTRIAGEDDLIFTTSGRVVDGKQMSVLGNLSLPWAGSSSFSVPTVITTDVARSRVYYAHGGQLAVYDSSSLILVDELTMPGIGSITDVIRYGERGLAATTNQGKLVLIESGVLVPSGEPTDLTVSLSHTPDAALLDADLTYIYEVKNVSTVEARDVTVSLSLGEGQAFVSTTHDDPQVDADSVQHRLGNLAPGESVSIETTVSPTVLTSLITTVAATTTSLDINYLDNKSTKLLNVAFNSEPESVNVIALPFTAHLVNPVSGNLILVTSSEADSSIKDHVIEMDPHSGRILQAIALPGNGNHLALSDNGQVAYVLRVGGNVAYRVDLATGVYTKTVDFGDINIDDIEVLKGTTDTIVLGSGWDGVRVYDDGVVRAQTSGTYNGDQVELLPEPDLVFAFNTEHTGADSFKLEINAGGVSTLVTKPGLISAFTGGLKADGYHVFSPRGHVVRADSMAVVGTIDLSGLDGSSFGSTAMEPDLSKGRVYFSRSKSITSFEAQSRLVLRSKTFAELTDNIVALERWGGDGLAARLNNGHLAIIRSNLVPATSGAMDLVVELADGAIVTEPELIVYGEAYGAQGIATVSVNGVAAGSIDGFAHWSATIPMSEGTNTITTTVTPNGSGDPEMVTRTIVYEPSLEVRLATMALADLGLASLPDGWAGSDPDGDGMGHRAELLFGGGSLQYDEVPMVDRPGLEDSGTLSYRRLRDQREHYHVAVSEDFQTWDMSEALISEVGEPQMVAEDSRYEDVRIQVVIGDRERVFLQVVVE